MLYFMKILEININSDLGEKSEFHSTKYDPDLLKIVNSANIACGFRWRWKTTEIQLKFQKK